MPCNSDYMAANGYEIDCTGDCVVGDEIRFDRAIFSGSWRNPKFAGFEQIIGTIVRDSYGTEKQQHTFTIELKNGETTKIKGRNLYRNGVCRKPWADESKRNAALDEKHNRGDRAREARQIRGEKP